MNSQPKRSQNRRVLTAILICLAIVVCQSAVAQDDGKPPRDDEGLPQFADMKLPTAAELQEKPVDWIRLNTDEVVVSEPVIPRPDTLLKLEEQITALRGKPRPIGEEQIDARRKERDALNFINVVLPGNAESPEFRLATRHVKEIIYHEDMVLKQLDELLKAGDLGTSYQLLIHLENRAPEWKGVDRRRNDIFFAEADAQREAGRPAAALVFLEELHGRNSDYPQLQQTLGELTQGLVDDALKSNDLRRARHYLGRLNRLEGKHPVLVKFRDQLTADATKLMNAAKAANQSGDYADAAESAATSAQTWPITPGLSETHRTATRRWQTLRVGVMRLPGEQSPFFLDTQPDRRARYLTESTLFEISRFDRRPTYRTRYFEQWLPTDLGRQLQFTLRSGQGTWESRPTITSSQMVAALQTRVDPESELYSERLAEAIRRMSIRSPYQFDLELAHVTPRTEALFRFPLPDAARRTDDGKLPVLSQRFVVTDRSAAGVTYRRAISQADKLRLENYHIAEVIEQKYADAEQAVQDFARGELDMLLPLRLTDIERFRKSGEFSIATTSLPVTHVLQFNPATRALRSRELRRSLAYALDRERILQEIFLAGAPPNAGRVVTAPIPTRHEAYNTVVEQRPQDLTLSVALRLASAKALKQNLPELRMVCDPDPQIVAAAEMMIAVWKRVGLKVTLLTDAKAVGHDGPVERDSSEWDLVYRTVQMAEPLTELWPFLTFDDQVRVSSLRTWPDWLRQEFLKLETAGDEAASLLQVKRLHRLLSSEVMTIPLWEIETFMAIRPEVKNLPGEPVYPYQDIEQWTIERKLPPLWP